MLELFSAGLVSGWLAMAGLPSSLDPTTLVDLPGVQPLIWPVQTGDTQAQPLLKQYLQQLTSQGLNTGNQSIWVQAGAQPLIAHQGFTPLPAASLTKIATSLAALQTWTPEHQFETLIQATGPIRDGVLQGDLLIQGGGDPGFVWEDAIAVGLHLNHLGVKKVTGDLIIGPRFMLNFEPDALKTGVSLRRALNYQTWDREIRDAQIILKDQTLPAVTIGGTVKTLATQPANLALTPLLRHRSLPLRDLLKKMNVYSNNQMSQTLTENLGGVQAMRQAAITAAGISPEELQFVNGSGLSPENRISARAACALFAAIEQKLYHANLTIADVFPVAGIEGIGTTLEGRQIPAQAVVKTGTLSQVSALAGVLPTRDRGLVWFAIINQGTDITSLRQQQDRLLQRLQQQWGTSTIANAMIQRTQALPEQRSAFAADTRNEIVYGG